MHKFLTPTQKSPAYLICGIFFLLIGFTGIEYGAFIFYCIPALICFAQYFYPTKVGWLVVFIPVLAGSGLYLFAVVKDVFTILTGSRPDIFVNVVDSAVFSLGIVLLISLAVWLWVVRPRKNR